MNISAKKLWELIESCATRMNNVRDFLEDVEPTLEYNIVAIGDMFGPTKDDPTFQVKIISITLKKKWSETIQDFLFTEIDIETKHIVQI